MKHALAFLATLLFVPIAAWSAEASQTETGLGYAVASQLEEFLGEPLFVPMQQLWEKRGGWGGVLTAKDGTVVALRSPSELRPGDTKGILRDGTEINDIAGLRNYFAGPRREDLLRSLARKLTGYALGRAVMTSDRKLVDELTKTMTGGGRWSDALLVIVRSEQFRCIRPGAES